MTPLDYTDAGTWTLRIVETIDYDSYGTTSHQYNGVTITVGCTINQILTPAPPAEPAFSLTYTLYETTLPIDLSALQYV